MSKETKTKQSPRIPILVITSSGEEALQSLSNVFSLSVDLQDALNPFINRAPGKHSVKRTRGESIESIIEPESIIDKLGLPEMTETLVSIWDAIKTHGRSGEVETYISRELKENMPEGEELYWDGFLQCEAIEELIEIGWLEEDFDIIEHFKSRAEDEGISMVIHDHTIYLGHTEDQEEKADEHDNIWELIKTLENKILTPRRREELENLKNKISAFNLAHHELHESLTVIKKNLYDI